VDAPVLLVEHGAIVVANAAAGGRRVVLAVSGRDCVVPAPGRDEEVVALTDAVLAPAEPSAEQLLEVLRDREESLVILALPRHADRVRAKLLQLARGHGKVTADGILIALPLTHELIADMTASARETVTWSLRDLSEEGFVRREGRQYVVRVSPQEL
jgi:CRP-like cAMP-binding protein